jgi:hypothetical protein
MRRKILGIFDKRPLIWFHYVLLVGALYGSWYLGDYLFKESFIEWYIMLPFFFITLSVADQLIHKILKVD